MHHVGIGLACGSMWYQVIDSGSISGGDHLHSGTVVGKLRWSKPPAVSELEIS